MKKHNRFAQTLIFALLTSFLYMSCENLFSPVVKEKPEDTAEVKTEDSEGGKKGIVKISLNNEASRTIYPSAPKFEQYRLEFAGTGTQSPITCTPAELSSINISLTPGSWTITAFGQITFSGSLTDVAKGSAIVNVEEGKTVPASIMLRSSTAGAQGTFSWSIAAPQGVEADVWAIVLVKFDSSSEGALLKGGTFDPSSGVLSKSGEVKCDPGYYLLEVKVGNAKQGASRMEVVLIHSGLQSNAQFSFAEDDFIKLISVKGTLNLSTSGVSFPLSDFNRLQILLSKQGLMTSVSESQVNLTDGTWEMLLPAQTELRTLNFSIWAETNDGHHFDTYLNSSIDVSNGDIEGFAINEELISLSGTVGGVGGAYAVQVWGDTAAGSAKGASSRINADSSWKLYLPPSATGFKPTFHVYSETYGAPLYTTTPELTVGQADIAGISIESTQITLSGTLSILKDSLPIDYSNISSLTADIGSDSYDALIDKDGNWEISVDPQAEPVEVTFSFYQFIYQESTIKEIIIKLWEGNWFIQNESMGDIGLTAEYFTARGTANITIDGTKINPTYVTYHNSNVEEFDYCTGYPDTDGNWFCSIPVQNSETFSLQVDMPSESPLSNFNFVKDSTAPITAIEINNSFISVSGTASLSIGGTPVDPNNLKIIMREKDNGYYIQEAAPDTEGKWIMFVDVAEPVTVRFQVSETSLPCPIYFDNEVTIDSVKQQGINLIKDVALTSVSGALTGADFSNEHYFVNVTQEPIFQNPFTSVAALYSQVDSTGKWNIPNVVSGDGWNFFLLHYAADESNTTLVEAFNLKANVTVTSTGVSDLDADISILQKTSITIGGVLSGFETESISAIWCMKNNILSDDSILNQLYMLQNEWSMVVPAKETNYEVYFLVLTTEGYYITEKSILIGTSDMEGIALSFADMVPVYPY